MVLIKTVLDENGQDVVNDFLNSIMEKSEFHSKFIIVMLEQLQLSPLVNLISNPTQLTIMTQEGYERTKRYILVKPLRKKPIYELRYGLSSNCHLRLLFFPISKNKKKYYLFTHAFVKTRIPPSDETDKFRDESYNLYRTFLENPDKFNERVV